MYSFSLATLVTATFTFAQQDYTQQEESRGPSSNDFSYLNLTLSGSGVAECGARINDDNTFDLYIHSIPTTLVCFGLYGSSNFIAQNDTDNEAATSQFEGYQAPEEPCPEGRDDCGVRYSLSRQTNFNSTTQYTQVLYSQQRPETNENNSGFGELAFRTYYGANCDFNENLPRIYSWNCEREEGEAECANLGEDFIIGSFSIESVTEEQRSGGTCLIAAEESGASDGMVAGKSLLLALASFVLTYVPIGSIL